MVIKLWILFAGKTDDDKYVSYSNNLPSGIAHVPRFE